MTAPAAADPAATLSLWDFRRRVADLYREARAGGPGEGPWRRWRTRRDLLFATHPQSPVDPTTREAFSSLPFFPYDPAWRMTAEVEPVETRRIGAAHSATGETPLVRFGQVRLPPPGNVTLSVFWIDVYGGGVFVPFRDATAGATTYGGGRYLLDTIKGADLGHEGTAIVLDFNYAYHPSCVHDPRWSCPLAPADNHLDIAIEAGERLESPPG